MKWHIYLLSTIFFLCNGQARTGKALSNKIYLDYVIFYSTDPSEKEYFKTSFHKHVVVEMLIVFFPSSGSNIKIIWSPSISANLPASSSLLTDSLSMNTTQESPSISSSLKMILIKKHEQSFIKASCINWWPPALK